MSLPDLRFSQDILKISLSDFQAAAAVFETEEI
jgi:hypothetical protein